MRVAFVVPDDERHGVTRYARELAAALGAQGVDVDVLVTPLGGVAAAVRTGRRARRADVVHLQLSDGYWAPGRRQLLVAAALRTALAGRPVVVTAHDFHTPHRRMPVRPGNLLRYLRGRRGAYDATTRVLLRTASLVLTCTESEGRHLEWAHPRRRAVVPHHVSAAPPTAPATAASSALAGRSPGGAPVRSVVLGWIHRRKGQHRAVEALPRLTGHELVLAGAAPARSTDYLRSVQERAVELGVDDRLVVTGFLPDEELFALLRTCDVALAPYERIAASGSLATLASVGLPVVALENDYSREMAAQCPSAVALYRPDDPEALAAAVVDCLGRSRSAQAEELRRWAEDRSVGHVAHLLAGHYRGVVARAPHGPVAQSAPAPR